ncbi:MAG TPA: transposase [Patescibacteria group bacterium]|nr:transposase [Patescibacteria group bacterium]
MVLVEDESRIEFEAKQEKIWAKKGVYPKVEYTGEKTGRCFYGASNLFKKEHIIHVAEWMNSTETVLFLKKVKARYQRRLKPKQKVLLLWDGSPVHRGEVKEYLKTNADWLELMYFSAYSPELNPQEWMWKEAKKEVCLNHEEQKFEELEYKFYRYLISHQLSPSFSQKILGF